MSGITLGPFVLSTGRFAFIAGVMAFLLLVALVKRFSRDAAGLDGGSTLLLLIGLAVGRLGHVLRNAATYREEPLSVLAFWQGGFDPVAAFVAAAITLAVLALRRGGRVPGLLLATGMAGVLVWQTILHSLPAPQFALPQASFAALDGPPVTLATGQPVVINLWASWCPPCRRELPMMMELAEATPGVQCAVPQSGRIRPGCGPLSARAGTGH